MVQLADMRPWLRAVPVFSSGATPASRTDGYFHAPLRPEAQVDRANPPRDAARAEYRGSLSAISQATASGLTQVRQP